MTAPAYLDLTQVKSYFANNEVATTSKWDTLVTTLCTNLSRAWDKLTFREPGAYAVASDTTRFYDGVPTTATSYATNVFTAEMAQSPTTVSISTNGDPAKFNALASTDYFVWPYNAAAEGKPYMALELNIASGQTKTWPSAPRSIQVVAHFGYSLTLPDDVAEALYLYIVRLVRKAQQNYLDVATILDSGQIMTGMKRDEDLMQLIALYRAWRDS